MSHTSRVSKSWHPLSRKLKSMPHLMNMRGQKPRAKAVLPPADKDREDEEPADEEPPD